MTSGQAGSAHSQDPPEWPMTIASLIVGASFFALWFWMLPSWLGFPAETVRGELATAAAVVLGVSLFVQLYEEPTLRRMFGADYEEYCHNVHRWLPRAHA
jgi:protein-S-isoprenylcysteine O-methyltransferase Ste14